MRNRRKTIIAIAVVLAMALAAGLFLISGRDQSPPAKPAAGYRLLSPFTGEPVAALGGVLAVKIDNIAQARPQTGLSKADIVYVLPVEGGLTRLLAIFSSHPPAVVGPVRSAREADLDLLRQFGQPAFAYSGAQPQLLPVIGTPGSLTCTAAGRTGTSGTPGGQPRTTSMHTPTGYSSRLRRRARPGTSASTGVL